MTWWIALASGDRSARRRAYARIDERAAAADRAREPKVDVATERSTGLVFLLRRKRTPRSAPPRSREHLHRSPDEADRAAA